MIASDLYEVYVCNDCGFFGYNKYCTHCQDKNQVYKVKMPYACKLLLQELTSMGIRAKMGLRDV